jgi:hypothetical protein
VPFGYGLIVGLATQCSPGFKRPFTSVTHTQSAWPVVRPAAGHVDVRPHGSRHANEVGDVVGWASHRLIASPACLPGRLLVAQPVKSAVTPKPDKTLRDLIALWRSRARLTTMCNDRWWRSRKHTTGQRSALERSALEEFEAFRRRNPPQLRRWFCDRHFSLQLGTEVPSYSRGAAWPRG